MDKIYVVKGTAGDVFPGSKDWLVAAYVSKDIAEAMATNLSNLSKTAFGMRPDELNIAANGGLTLKLIDTMWHQHENYVETNIRPLDASYYEGYYCTYYTSHEVDLYG